MDSYKFFAFISYSHLDKRIARKLYRRLNFYRLPKAMKSNYINNEGHELPDRISPIFIDDEEMASLSVMEGMRAGLERSRFLIVVCSPNSAKSPYVNSEVEYFIKNGRGDYIIPYIISGKPCSGDPATECYPEAMRNPDRLGADVQDLKEDAVLRVIAMMLKVDMGVLAQQEKHRREKTIISVAAVLTTIALAFGFYNNYMRKRIEDENWRYRTSLSNQLLQAGESAEQNGNDSEAMMYYAEALQTQPSNEYAQMNALIVLQNSGWLTSVNDDYGENNDISADYESTDDLGKLIGNDKFGYQNYDVYQKDDLITLVSEDGATKYQAQIPEKYRSEFWDEYNGDYWTIYSALVKRDEEVRLILAAKSQALVYSFENQGDSGKQVHAGKLVGPLDLRKIGELYLEGEIADVQGVYGSARDGRALLVLGIVPETPILIDVFEGRVICALDMGEDVSVTYAAFEKNGEGIAVLAKVYPQSTTTNTRIRYYDKNGNLLRITKEVDGLNQLRNIDYSPDGKALALCRNESVFIFSTEKDILLCPKLRSDRIFKRAEFSPSGSVIVKFGDGTRSEYELRYFEPAREYAVEPLEKVPEKKDNIAGFWINDDLIIINGDPNIDLINSNKELLDTAEGVMFLPDGINDGFLWWGECTADREASVAFVYGFLEEVFYRVRYDEELSKIIKVEPIVLEGRNSIEVVAFDDMCAVRTSDDCLLGYRNDSNEPFYAMNVGNIGQIIDMKWIGGDVIAIEYESYDEDTPGRGYSLELWNVSTGRRISRLERNSESLITDLKYRDGVFSYWKGDQSRYWILRADDPDETAIQFLAKLSQYKQDENGISRFTTPKFTGDMGNWGKILKCIGNE